METGSWPENLASTIQKKVNDELIEGRELAKQLRSVLASSDDGSRSAEDLLVKIVKSFSNTLSILNVKEGHDNVVSLTSQIQTHLPCLDARNSKDHSRESFRRSTIPPTKMLDRKGCYDRRRTSRSSTLETWKIDTPTLTNDGQAWRKYGQKVILKAKYPRHYFRCTYKHDQGCKATKQIQRIQVNPPLHRTTYFGHHTCRNDLHQDPELMLDSTSPSDTSMFISFHDGTKLTNKQDFLSSFSSAKQEFKEEIIKCEANLQHNQSLLSDYFVSFPFPASMPVLLTSNLECDNGDAIDRVMDYDDFYDLDIFL